MNRKSGGNHKHLVGDALIDRRKKHARKPRIKRQQTHRSSDVRQSTFRSRCAQLDECRTSIREHARAWRIDKREVLGLPEIQRLHLQNHTREIRAQNLRRRKRRARREIFLRIKPHGEPRAESTSASRALSRTCLRNFLDGESLYA